MESPVVVDKPPEYHGKSNERGFPFDEEEGSGAWSELAARHPDIAARLRSRPATWANKRRPSSQDATDEFGDNFSGFDRFPFDDIPPEFREHFPSHWNRRFGPRDEPQTQPASDRPQPQQHPQQHQQQSPHQQTTSTQTEQDPGPSTQTQIPQYGLRNTVDLGQKSPTDPSLVDADDRNQRSMSAPPDSCTANQSHTPKMSAQNHQEQHQGHPPQHSDHQQQSNVRHIPIFVEGRDEPVINKNVDHGTHFGESKPQYAPPPQPQPQPHIEREQYFPDDGPVFHPPPNFSRAFGTPFNKGFRQGPQPFVQQKVYPQTAFTRGASPQRSQSPKPQMHQDEHFVKVPVHHEHAAPKFEPQPRPQPKQPPPQTHQQQQPPQQAPPKQQTPPPQPKPQPSPNDPITQILSIQTDVLNLMTDVENFTGSKKDKRYLYLDEMLTRNLIKLDNIETDGKENIRQARKEAIKCIQKCIAVLEAKAEKGGSTPQPQDVEMNEDAAAAAEEKVAENGVEVEMKDAPKEEKVEEVRAADQQAETKEEPVSQEETSKAAEPETKVAAEPQAADTRPEETKPSETTPEEKKNEQVVDKKASSKKGTKNVKKRDKSKDSKKESKDSNKEQTAEEQKTEAKAEGMQIDDKGDKTETQTMDVDGAASQ